MPLRNSKNPLTSFGKSLFCHAKTLVWMPFRKQELEPCELGTRQLEVAFECMNLGWPWLERLSDHKRVVIVNAKTKRSTKLAFTNFLDVAITVHVRLEQNASSIITKTFSSRLGLLHQVRRLFIHIPEQFRGSLDGSL